MSMKRVLFVCVENSNRSQMAEAWFNKVCGEDWEARSAGLEPGVVNPTVIEAMREVGIDISRKKTQAVFEVWKSGELFTYVVTVYNEADAEGCPIFPGPAKRLHWPFPDPSKFQNSRMIAISSPRPRKPGELPIRAHHAVHAILCPKGAQFS